MNCDNCECEETVLKKTAFRLVAGYFVILILTNVAVLLAGRTYTAYVMNLFDSERITVDYAPEGIVENTRIETVNGTTAFTFRSVKPGKTIVTATIRSEKNDTDYTTDAPSERRKTRKNTS